jgi:hypothetical protein
MRNMDILRGIRIMRFRKGEKIMGNLKRKWSRNAMKIYLWRMVKTQ